MRKILRQVSLPHLTGSATSTAPLQHVQSGSTCRIFGQSFVCYCVLQEKLCWKLCLTFLRAPSILLQNIAVCTSNSPSNITIFQHKYLEGTQTSLLSCFLLSFGQLSRKVGSSFALCTGDSQNTQVCLARPTAHTPQSKKSLESFRGLTCLLQSFRLCINALGEIFCSVQILFAQSHLLENLYFCVPLQPALLWQSCKVLKKGVCMLFLFRCMFFHMLMYVRQNRTSEWDTQLARWKHLGKSIFAPSLQLDSN